MRRRKLIHTKYNKLVAWLAISGALLGFVSLTSLVVSTQQNEYMVLCIVFILNCVGIVGGVKLLKNELFGLELLMVFFGFQAVGINSPNFNFNLISGISLNLHFKIHEFVVAINFFALIFFILSVELVLKQNRSAKMFNLKIPNDESP